MQTISHQIKGSNDKIILIDITFKKSDKLQPVILFCHGFKGFKNWGHFDEIAQAFAQQGFVFVKFNFSHNGTTINQPTDFADLAAFSENNFSKELNDLGFVIDFVEDTIEQFSGNKQQLNLIGHSRGGGIAILKAFEDKRIKRLITWASVKDFEDFFKHQNIDNWRKEKYIYILNGRTNQNMPMHVQIYEDFLLHKHRLEIAEAAKKINIPWLIVHGENDTSVSVACAKILHQQNEQSQLLIIENADHTFSGKHPWNNAELPTASKQLIAESIRFLQT
ncbi:MAG: alpha/beta fold hydrolase [Bacteroidetes bacterium]|nr:alpha/beta fold hydrolase [Bacteroidota bacterium]